MLVHNTCTCNSSGVLCAVCVHVYAFSCCHCYAPPPPLCGCYLHVCKWRRPGTEALVSTHMSLLFFFSLHKDLADALKSPHHWLALHIIGGQGHTSYTCYIVRCPLSPCVLLAGVRKQHLSWILDVRCTVNEIYCVVAT